MPTRGGGAGWFAVVVVALVAGAGLQVASPLVVRAFLDLAQAGAAVERLVGVALFIGVAVAGSGLEIVRSHAGTVLAWQAMNSLRRTLFRHTVDRGHSSSRGPLPAPLLERIDGDVARLGRLLSDLLAELAANLLMTGGIVGVLLFEEWRVGVAVAAFAVVGAVVVDRVRALGVPRFVRSRAASAAFFGRLSEWLAAGTVLGLVGSTGGGKSTVARLLVRMIELQEGSVRLGGVPVRDLGSHHLRQRVAMLPQETEILPGSLRDMLPCSTMRSRQRRWRALFQSLGAGTWLQGLGAGVETVIGPDGRELSSGERQLVAIARILLRERSLVILDEPAARIDPATETLVRGALAQLLRGRTGLVIAHRRATLDLVDSVALLERGTIVERIPRSELEAAAESRIAAFLERGGMA